MAKSQGQQRIRQARRALRKERESGHGTALDVNAAIYGNLKGTIGNQKNRWSRANNRLLSRMQNLQAQVKEGQGRIAKRTGTAGPSAMAGVAKAAFRGSKASANAGQQISRGAGLDLSTGRRTGNRMMGLAEAGAREAEAGAEFGLHRALAMRTQQDVALTAQMQNQLDQTVLQGQIQERQFELQNEAQIKMMDMQHAYDLEKMEKDATLKEQLAGAEFEQWKAQVREEQLIGVGGVSGMVNVLNQGIEAVPAMRAVMTQMQQSGEPIDPATLLASLTEAGVDAADPENPNALHPFYSTMAAKMQEGAFGGLGSRAEPVDFAVDTVVESIVSTWPTIQMDEQQRAEMRTMVQKRIDAMFTREMSQAPPPSEQTDEQGNQTFLGFLRWGLGGSIGSAFNILTLGQQRATGDLLATTIRGV